MCSSHALRRCLHALASGFVHSFPEMLRQQILADLCFAI